MTPLRRPSGARRTAAERPPSPAPMIWIVPVIVSEQIAHYDADKLQTRQAHARTRGGKSACNQSLENNPIALPHDPRRAHLAARATRHDRVGFTKLLARQPNNV